MPKIVLSKGESLLKLMHKAGLIVDTFTGIWLLEKGSLQKIANKDSDYSILNIYAQGDYLMGDSDLAIDYIAIEDSIIVNVSLTELDPMQILYQLDAIEELMFVNSFKFEEADVHESGRLSRFFDWAGKRLGRKQRSIPYFLSQADIGKLVGANRVTVNRKLQSIKRLTDLGKDLDSTAYK
jgi:CRP-like cAMP-binding protein